MLSVMSDERHEESTAEPPVEPDAAPESPTEETLDVLLGETQAQRSIHVVGFTPVEPGDAPDMGGLPEPAEPVSAEPAPAEPQGDGPAAPEASSDTE
jgi:hypothetical protein